MNVPYILKKIDQFCEKFPLSNLTIEFREEQGECLSDYAEVEVFGDIAGDLVRDLPEDEVKFIVKNMRGVLQKP